MTRTKSNRERSRGGSSLIEFALVALLFSVMLLAFVEFGRMLLVYDSVANSAREGVRYAIVRGTGSPDSPRPAVEISEIVRVVKVFASSAPLNTDSLAVTVTRPSGAIGSLVQVRVVYPYDPLVGYFPLRVSLGSVSEGRIAF